MSQQKTSDGNAPLPFLLDSFGVTQQKLLESSSVAPSATRTGPTNLLGDRLVWPSLRAACVASNLLRPIKQTWPRNVSPRASLVLVVVVVGS